MLVGGMNGIPNSCFAYDFKQSLVKFGDKKLTEGTHYTVSYENNVKVGTASFMIEGVGNYGGTKKVTFKIKPKGFTWWWSK